MLISVIVPAYKKEDSIKADITNIYNVMRTTRWDFEIIVVIDGDDKTLEIAKSLDLPNVIAVGYKTNKGKGYAVRYGMARSKGDLVAFIDSGMEINANGISMLIEHMLWYDADIMVASKRHPASKAVYKGIRKLYSLGYYFGVKLLFGLNVTDTQTGLKVFKRQVLVDVLPRLLVKAFAFDIELLAVAHHLGYRKIYDAPVELTLIFTPDSKFKPGRPLFLDPNIRLMLLDTLAVFYRLYILGYYENASKRKWIYDEELMLNVNTGELLVKESNYPGHSNRDKNVYDSELMSKIRFSIVIPVRSINDYMRENIDYLQQLTYTNFEVLILTDKPENMNSFDPRFRIIPTGTIGPGEKRNIGVEVSTGDIIAFLDDDAYPSATWLDNAATIFKDKAIYALGAPAQTPPSATFLEKCSGLVLESFLASGGTTYRHMPKMRRHINDYPTVNFFVRKDVFKKVGGFTLDFWPGEDTKLCLDLVKIMGSDFLYDPSAVVYHHRRKLFVPHLKQVSRYGRHRGQFAKIFPENSRVLSYFIPSIFVLGLFLGLPVSLHFRELLTFYLMAVFAYVTLVFYESVKVSLYENNIIIGMYVGLGIILTHIIYGCNFLIGLIKTPKLKLKRFDNVTGNYIEG